ncbi:reverse transcriptase domain-containing protein [Tanacetum coccineum]
MCTRSQSRNLNRQQQQSPPAFVEPFNLEEPIKNPAPPVVTMDDNRTMAQLLEAPTEGYEDAIVVPEITVDNFELKHGLLTLVQNKKFFRHDKEDPHAHIRYFNKITSTMKFPNVLGTSVKLMLFPFSLEGAARIWLEKEPPRSILTWDDLVSKFINKFFPPSKTTNLRNEITRFQQRFDETFYEAWDRFNDLLRACPHHGFSELHQLDTFYNALNSNDQDSLNSAAGGNFLDKMPRDCLRIIESKSKVRNSRNKPVVAKVSSSTSTPGISSDVAELKDMVKALLLDKKNQSPAPTPVKAVEESCVTCGGTHSYQNCPATNGNVYRDNIQEYVSQAAAANYNQGNTGYRAPIANQIRPPGFPPVQNNQNNQGNNQNRYNQNRGNFNQASAYQPPVNQGQIYRPQIPVCYDDDDDEESSIPLKDIMISGLPPCVAIIPVLFTEEPVDSLIMENEHLDTIPETESDELIKSSVENLVQIPSESEDSSDESLLHRDTSINDSQKIDSLLDEFTGELTLPHSIPPGIDDVNLDPEGDILFLESLLYDNSSPRPPEEFNSENPTESFSPSPIPVKDSDSLMEEIDIFLDGDGSIPSGIESDDFDSEDDDNSTSRPEFESFHVDYPDSGDSTIDVVEDIPVDVPNIFPTQPALQLDFDFIPSNDLGSDLDDSSPTGDRNKIYDPGICIEVESTRFLSTLSPVIDTLLPFSSENKDKVFNHGVLASKEKSPSSPSHRGFKASKLFHQKSPMLISGDNIPNLGVRHPHFYPP